MGDRPNKQNIPGSHLRDADSWGVLENRQKNAKETSKKLKNRHLDEEEPLDPLDEDMGESNVGRRLEDGCNMREYD